ncbi:hypothetical protein QDG88_19715 [Pseudoalteromonas piscicida]|uniref:hypothetical protein n=1 Tax=Pseudoalteromonas piscicida TaxID=43662 RepID=UPI00273A5233|nr:hypothetical protein [Pseudoalteromonas piscicida]MDP4490142.1 hypothetical protein [Pseudoalteromonas piscicida]
MINRWRIRPNYAPPDAGRGGGGRGREEELSPTISNMPQELSEKFHELKLWSKTNKSDANYHRFIFWSLKVTAILCSTSAGIIAFFEIPLLSLVVGAIGTVCILIDGLRPRGNLYKAKLEAQYNIEALASELVDEWRASDKESPQEVSRLIKMCINRSKKITNDLKKAETLIKGGSKT